MRSPGPPSTTPREERSALIAGIAAFVFWGIIPVYWKLLRAVPATEILAHRFVWTTAFLVCLLTWQKRWPEVRQAMRSRRTILFCLASGTAISANWLIFIWAVNANRVLETSLGYFMTPIANV
nr:EamA family transporter RarD [Verrucomicrobiota bacterium]